MILKKRSVNKAIGKEEVSSRFLSIEDLSTVDENVLTEEEKKELDEEKKRRELDKESLGETEKRVSKNSSKKKKITSIVLFVVNLLVVAGILTYQLFQEKFVPLDGLGINVGMLILLFSVYLIMALLDTVLIAYLMKKDSGKWRFSVGFKATTVGRYYDCITPLAIGGQPFQVAYLRKYDVNSSVALSVPIAKTIFWQFSFLFLSIIALIASGVSNDFGAFASVMSIIGFVVSFAFFFLVLFLVISKNFGKKVIVKVLKLLQKIKIIKNYEKQYIKVTKYVEDFQNVMRQYMKSFKDFSISFLLTLVRLVLNYTIPFIIYVCFYTDGTPDLFFKFFVCGILIDLAASFFPLPGGTGMSEVTFTALFTQYFSGGRLFWALILWRLMTYYMYIIWGLFVQIYDFAYGNKKNLWQKKSTKLRNESDMFRQVQIQRFRKERAQRRKKELKNME